jgi:HD-GYP domain-containing protein (c-di-GMP phosphodiesterase class II)
MLHDIGKLFISQILLKKKGPIWETKINGTITEKEHIDEHTKLGLFILEYLEKDNKNLNFHEIVKLCVKKPSSTK